MEYLPYGDLLGYLRKSRGINDNYNTGEKRPNSRLTEKDLLSFAWMIADGMNYLATMKVNQSFRIMVNFLALRSRGTEYVYSSICIYVKNMNEVRRPKPPVYEVFM